MYTRFVNLLDPVAVAVPSDLRAQGLPTSITLIEPGLHDDPPTDIAWNPGVAPAFGWVLSLTPGAVFRLHSQGSRSTSDARVVAPPDRLPDLATARTTLEPTAEG